MYVNLYNIIYISYIFIYVFSLKHGNHVKGIWKDWWSKIVRQAVPVTWHRKDPTPPRRAWLPLDQARHRGNLTRSVPKGTQKRSTPPTPSGTIYELHQCLATRRLKILTQDDCEGSFLSCSLEVWLQGTVAKQFHGFPQWTLQNQISLPFCRSTARPTRDSLGASRLLNTGHSWEPKPAFSPRKQLQVSDDVFPI